MTFDPKRLQSRVPVQLRVVFQDVSKVLEAFSTNLGAGGMLLNSNRDMAVGSRIKIQFTLPGVPSEFCTTAEVAWRRQTTDIALGLRFTDLSEDDKQRIVAFVIERWSQLARSVVLAGASELLHGVLGSLLAQRGFRVLSATDGPEATQLLGDLRGVGVVLLDLLLPPSDGMHVLRALRSRPMLLAKHVPVILLVEGAASPLEMDRLRAEGASAVLTYGASADWESLTDAVLGFMGRPVEAEPSP